MSKKLPITNPANKSVQVSLQRAEQLLQVTHKILDCSGRETAVVDDETNWSSLSLNNPDLMIEIISNHSPLSMLLIKKYDYKWDWERLSRNKFLPWSETLIDLYTDKWDWDILSGNISLPW